MKRGSKQMINKSKLKANNQGQKNKVRKCHQSVWADGALGEKCKANNPKAAEAEK